MNNDEPEVIFEGNITISSTSDALFTASKLTVGIEDTLLIANAKIVLQRGHCYGLIGENGTGKTTFLRALHRYIADDGYLSVMYVGQNDAEREEHNGRTVIQHCLSGWRVPEEEGEENAREKEEKEKKCRSVLQRLGFRLLERPIEDLSGGWRGRLEIARSLVSEPDVLMLDEPTNHLDLEATFLLSGIIKELIAEGTTVLVVSHDAAFMDLISTDIISLHQQTIQCIPGNYSNFEEMAEQYRTYHEHLYEKRGKEETRQKKSLTKQKGKAKRSGNDKAMKQAASRERKAEERIGLYREDGKKYKLNSLSKLDERFLRLPARAQPISVHHHFTLNLPQSQSRFSDDLPLLYTENASIGYEKSEKLSDVTLNIRSGDKIALVGKNGSGKSTLMNFLMGKNEVTTFKGKVEKRGSVALLDQNQLAKLEQFKEMTCMAYIARHSHLDTPQKVRAYLGRYGLSSDELALLPIENLSGGLRVRLALADLFATSPPDILVSIFGDVLLLDEPTNHLDAETITAFGNALRDFQGALLVVSHNCGFLISLCNQLWQCQKATKALPGKLLIHKGEFLTVLRQFAESIVPPQERAALADMLTVRAMRQAVVVQQAGATTSLLVSS